MSNGAQNLSRLLHFIESLCDFADDVTNRHDCQFNIEIGDDKFKFGLSELVTEIRRCRHAILYDIGNCSDDESKQVMKGREILANKLLNAMNNGKVYFRWVDIENSEWQELTAYSLLANTFENAEFKLETIISHNDIVKGEA